ncbi:class I SAM-dependent methyltransferase [Pararhodobacter sp.]|uniref:class I SAM-dependent methyltransferase n=1 Tax=Pararhodobacter sp. TaxID=2127056 RepID=UPI002AFFA335|nr:class I SAM-dependent methyltransferase [Pararhodobacter sp.]
MADEATINALREATMAKLVAFREALKAYKRAAKQPPMFLHEKKPVKMRDDALENCRVFSDRFQMMRAMATGDVGAEVGVQRGDFSRFLLDEFSLKTLHLLDMSIPQIRPDVRSDPRVSLHGGDSSTNLKKIAPGSLDWAYIDGDHSYIGAMKDSRAAKVAVKPGGVLFFNDYTMWSPGEAIPYGVVAVVNEMVNEGHDMIAIALSPTGYFDVALRR